MHRFSSVYINHQENIDLILSSSVLLTTITCDYLLGCDPPDTLILQVTVSFYQLNVGSTFGHEDVSLLD